MVLSYHSQMWGFSSNCASPFRLDLPAKIPTELIDESQLLSSRNYRSCSVCVRMSRCINSPLPLPFRPVGCINISTELKVSKVIKILQY